MMQIPNTSRETIRRTMSRLWQSRAGYHARLRMGRSMAWANAHRFLTVVVLTAVTGAGIILPVVQNAIAANRYYINHDKRALLGNASQRLNSKLTFDAEKQVYHFNQAAVEQNAKPSNPLQKLQQSRIGDTTNGKQLYSIDMPRDLSKGMTYYDNQEDLQFTMEPTFATYIGEKQSGHLVYPLKDIAGQAVYTVKNNGLKEDILLDKAPEGGGLHLSFKLKVPKTLEARMIPGSNNVGIYSADPTLFGDISYGTSEDQSRVMKARENSPKNNLVFTIPAPVIRQTGTANNQVGASYSLDGDTLNLDAVNLDQAQYPLTVDPSVVVTSSSDFTTGNNEGNIDVGSGQINRGALTGGTVNAGWSTTSSAFTSNARYYTGAAAYNGYLYMVDGRQNTTNFNDYMYAPINSNGTVGAWVEVANTTTSGSLSVRYGLSAVAYNGYMYMLGGYDGSSYYNEVWSSPINATTGTLGAWTQTTSFANARYTLGSFAYNNNIYITTGYNGSTYYGDLQYAPINADGSIGTWTTSSVYINGSTNGAGGRYKSAVTVYNGYVYVAGGQNGGTFYNQVWYTKIQSSGDIAAWAQTTAFANTRYSPGLTAANGYLYVSGGNHDGSTTLYNDVQVAPINANGTVGTWRASSAFTTVRYAQNFVNYNGYLYIFAGGNTGGQLGDALQYVAIDSAGAVGNFATSSPTITALPAVRTNCATVAYNGYVYVLGGQSGTTASTAVATIYRATIGTDGSIGAWTTNATALPAARTGLAAVAYNNKMYIIGGVDTASVYYNTTYYSTITPSTGATGAWTAGNNLGTGNTRAYLGAAIYNNNIYAIGGSNGSATANHYATVYRSTLSTAGVPGTFSATTSLNNTNSTAARDGFGVAVYGDRLYVLGGNTGAARLNDIQYASFNTSGTLSSWSIASTTFTTNRDKLMVGAANGNLYILGGYTGSVFQNDIQYAPILSNGDIGTWTANGTTFTTSRSGGVGFSYNGWLYVGAGQTTSTVVVADMQAALIGNGGLGTTGTWTATGTLTSLPEGRFNHGAIAYNGYLYVLGGWNGSTYNTTATTHGIIYAPINSDGTLGSWVTSPVSMPTNTTNAIRNRINFGIAAYNGYIYITGGNDGTNDLLDTEYIKMNADGSLGSWALVSAGNLSGTDGYYGVRLSAYNGYLYATGGVSAVSRNVVQYVALGSNGNTTGSWANTSAFTSARYEHAAVAYGGYLYVLGGTDDTTLMSSVQYAPINSNGTLGTFLAGPNLPQPRKNFDVVARDGFIYVLGGTDGVSTYYGDTEAASINANGSLSGWSATTAFSTPRFGHRAAVYNGYVFITGGADSGNNYNYVQNAQLNVIDRTSTYSTMINLGAAVALLTSIGSNGSFTNGSISYETAGSDGIFSAAQSSSGVTTPSCALASNNAQYIWLFVTMDDSLTGLFNDATANNASNITDITVNYKYGRPPTNLRMHGGKYFAGQTQTPLDTCGL